MASLTITLAEAKAFIRVDHTTEDALIQQLIMTAVETAFAHADGLPATGAAPDSVKTAALLHIARLYDDRHSDNPPQAAATLASRYRNWSV